MQNLAYDIRIFGKEDFGAMAKSNKFIDTSSVRLQRSSPRYSVSQHANVSSYLGPRVFDVRKNPGCLVHPVIACKTFSAYAEPE